tara:strand:+ start:53 stop:358 length:306 start_codon:yes stop_codon:yes gene_type:complete
MKVTYITYTSTNPPEFTSDYWVNVPSGTSVWDNDNILDQTGNKYALLAASRSSWVGNLEFRIRITLGDISTVGSWVKTTTNYSGTKGFRIILGCSNSVTDN